MRRMSRARAVCAALLALPLALSLTGCGGSNDNEQAPANPTPPPPVQPTGPQRGDLLETPPPLVKTYTASDLLALVGQGDVGKALADVILTPKCDVSVHQLKYQTVGTTGEAASATAVNIE